MNGADKVGIRPSTAVSRPDLAENFYFGVPNKPSTPVKEVVCNDFGSFAAIAQLFKDKHIVSDKISIRKSLCPRDETRSTVLWQQSVKISS